MIQSGYGGKWRGWYGAYLEAARTIRKQRGDQRG
jgi:hypothetical protein